MVAQMLDIYRVRRRLGQPADSRPIYNPVWPGFGGSLGALWMPGGTGKPSVYAIRLVNTLLMGGWQRLMPIDI